MSPEAFHVERISLPPCHLFAHQSEEEEVFGQPYPFRKVQGLTHVDVASSIDKSDPLSHGVGKTSPSAKVLQFLTFLERIKSSRCRCATLARTTPI